MTEPIPTEPDPEAPLPDPAPEEPEVLEPDPLAPDEEGLVPPFSPSKFLRASKAAQNCDSFASRVEAACWSLGTNPTDEIRKRAALFDAVNADIRVDSNLTVSTTRVTDEALVDAVQDILDRAET